MNKGSQEHLPARLWWVLAGLTVVWGFNWTAMKVAIADIATFTFRTLCLGLGSGVLFAFLRASGQPDMNDADAAAMMSQVAIITGLPEISQRWCHILRQDKDADLAALLKGVDALPAGRQKQDLAGILHERSRGLPQLAGAAMPPRLAFPSDPLDRQRRQTLGEKFEIVKHPAQRHRGVAQ